MRIIQTCPYLLASNDFGGARRVVSIAQYLAGAGHLVTMVAPGRKPATPLEESIRWRSYRQAHRVGYFFNPGFRQVLAEQLRRRPDFLLVEFPYQAAMIVKAARRHKIPFVYDAHNVESDRFRQTHSRAISTLVEIAERFLCRHAAGILTVTSEDRDRIEQRYGRTGIVLPNGVDVDKFKPGAADSNLQKHYGLENRKIVLFFGGLDYAPNRDALRFLAEIWPWIVAQIPEAVLLIVGRHPPAWTENIPNAVVTGSVKDIVAHIRLAHLVVNPMLTGGGSGLKIPETLACGKAVLSTPFGARGFVRGENAGIYIERLENFPLRLEEILRDGETDTLTEQARQYSLDLHWNSLLAKVPWESFRL